MMREDSFSQPLFVKALVISGILHLALFVWIAFGGKLRMGTEGMTVIPVTLVSGPVGGPPPQKVKSEAAPPSSEKGEAKEAKREPDRMKKPDKSKSKAKSKEEEKKIRSAIEKIKREAESERLSSQSDGVSGVVGPYGGGLTGTIASFYLQEIWDAIRRNWSMPKVGVDVPKDARVSFLVKLSPSGQIISVNMLKASGYELFDNSALVAIKKAAPFSAPPSMLVDTLRKEGIEVRFFAEESSR